MNKLRQDLSFYTATPSATPSVNNIPPPTPPSPSVPRQQIPETMNLLVANLSSKNYDMVATKEFHRLLQKKTDDKEVLGRLEALTKRQLNYSYQTGEALANSVRYYGTLLLSLLSTDALTHYLSTSFQASRLAIIVVERYIYQNDPEPLNILLSSDNRIDRTSSKAYSLMLARALRHGSPDLALTIYRKLPFSIKKLKQIARDYLTEAEIYEEIQFESPIAELLALAYSDYETRTEDLATVLDQAVFPLAEYGQEPTWDSNFEVYLRMYSEYRHGVKLLADIVDWDHLKEQKGVVEFFINQVPSADELRDYDEQVAMDSMIRTHPQGEVLEDFYHELTAVL